MTIGVGARSANRADLDISVGASISFDVEWWADEDETTPIPMESASARIVHGGQVVFDLSNFITIPTAPYDYKALVRVPSSSVTLVSGLTPDISGYALWEFEAVDVGGDHVKLVWGIVTVSDIDVEA